MLGRYRVCFLSMLIFGIFVLARPAHAYVDPGTAGMLYQIVILALGVIAGYFAFLRKFIRRLFGRNSRRGNNEEDI